jgi:hypothetical protein
MPLDIIIRQVIRILPSNPFRLSGLGNIHGKKLPFFKARVSLLSAHVLCLMSVSEAVFFSPR